MIQWPSDLFVVFAVWALIWWLMELAAELAASYGPPSSSVETDDDLMEDPLWLEIADAAEEFLRSGDRLARHRLERALEAV